MITTLRILNELCEFHKGNPGLGVCQMLKMAADRGGWDGGDLSCCPDSVILDGLETANGKKEVQDG